MPASATLQDFFLAEERNTRQAIANGDLEPGFPLTLRTAFDSLRQAPEDVQLLWMTGDRDGEWADAFETLMEFVDLIDQHGFDVRLMEFMG